LKFFNPYLVSTSPIDGIDSSSSNHPSKDFIPTSPTCPWTYNIIGEDGWRGSKEPLSSLLNSGGTYGVYVGYNWVYQYRWTGVKSDWGSNPKPLIGYTDDGFQAGNLDQVIAIPIRASISSLNSISMDNDWILENQDSQWLMRAKGIVNDVDTIGSSSFYFVPINTTNGTHNYSIHLTTSDGSNSGFHVGSEFTFTMDYVLIPRALIYLL
jgi:hypothetical protein